MDQYAYYLIFPAILLVGYIAGTIIEKKHYHAIENRERAYRHLPTVTAKTSPYSDNDIQSAKLVYGSLVISVGFFKRFLAILQNIFGGALTSYESLIDRARRESLLRMKETAKDASMIINVRIETSIIGSTSLIHPTAYLESIAYGTAIYLER